MEKTTITGFMKVYFEFANASKKSFVLEPFGLPFRNRPEIRGSDDGIWRRVREIPFNRQFTEAEQDNGRGEKLSCLF